MRHNHKACFCWKLAIVESHKFQTCRKACTYSVIKLLESSVLSNMQQNNKRKQWSCQLVTTDASQSMPAAVSFSSSQ